MSTELSIEPAAPASPTSASPVPPVPAVQAAPHTLNAQDSEHAAQIKVDVAVRSGNLLVVGGWCTAALELGLFVDGMTCVVTRCEVDRPDVGKHFALPDSARLGFALLAEDIGEGAVALRWSAGDDTPAVISKVLEFSPAGTLRPSQAAAMGGHAQRLQAEQPQAGAARANRDIVEAAVPAAPQIVVKPPPLPRRRETRTASSQAFIVGAAAGVDLSKLSDTQADIFALNGAHFHLQALGIEPFALVTGDRRFLVRHGLRNLSGVRKIVAFDYVLDSSDLDYLNASTIVETFACLGRDGFSTDSQAGFFHGCSSFFLAIQYLAAKGYKRVSTLGVKFPPPELYARVNANVGQPEFVYGTQLDNLAPLRRHLSSAGVAVRCHERNSNLALFL